MEARMLIAVVVRHVKNDGYQPMVLIRDDGSERIACDVTPLRGLHESDSWDLAEQMASRYADRLGFADVRSGRPDEPSMPWGGFDPSWQWGETTL